jgi:hypothetical protein
VTPGHPFDTKARDDLRSRQRRFLRTIPDDTLREALKPERFDDLVDEAIRDEAEEAFRAKADEMITALPDGLAFQLERKRRATALRRQFELRITSLVPSLDPPDIMNPIVQEAQKDSFGDVVIENAELLSLAQIAILLVWADLLEGEYTDSRIVRLIEKAKGG